MTKPTPEAGKEPVMYVVPAWLLVLIALMIVAEFFGIMWTHPAYGLIALGFLVVVACLALGATPEPVMKRWGRLNDVRTYLKLHPQAAPAPSNATLVVGKLIRDTLAQHSIEYDGPALLTPAIRDMAAHYAAADDEISRQAAAALTDLVHRAERAYAAAARRKIALPA